MAADFHGSEYSLKNLMDVSAFQDLLQSFNSLTGIATAILDPDGAVLTASGWRRICTEFHRKHPAAAERCRESDTKLANRLAEGKKYNVYKCGNGLVDVAVPIIIHDVHLGNIFMGQFLLEPPDLDFFSRQAEQFGFDKQRYLECLGEVPILSGQQVEQAMNFLFDLTAIIVNSGLDKKKLDDLNRELEKRIERRTEEIRAEKIFSDSLISSLPGIMYVFDEKGRCIRWNKNFEKVTGYAGEQIRDLNLLDLFRSAKTRDRVVAAIEEVFKKGNATVEAGFTALDGREIPYLLTGYAFHLDQTRYLVGTGIDISDRIRTEREKQVLIDKLHETLATIRKLSGFLPICSSCKKIRDDEGYWNQIEEYIRDHSEVEFSHSICPDCARKLYPYLKLK